MLGIFPLSPCGRGWRKAPGEGAQAKRMRGRVRERTAAGDARG
jgi:hypothetical protein